jgi:Tfp pilus assembly protein PilF
MMLESAFAELWLAKRDLVQARPQAEQLLKSALATPDRAWQARAWETNARVALAEGNLQRAQECIAKALQTMVGFELPLVSWRIHSTASEICQLTGDRELAEHHHELSRTTILQLANSLPPEEPLRTVFLSAPPIRRILGGTHDPGEEN